MFRETEPKQNGYFPFCLIGAVGLIALFFGLVVTTNFVSPELAKAIVKHGHNPMVVCALVLVCIDVFALIGKIIKMELSE